MVVPPVFAGGVNETTRLVCVGLDATTPVGASGIVTEAVAGKTAVTVIEAASVFTALLVTLVAPAIEKKFAVMPFSV
jgi:hypothetical protein